MLAGYGNIEHRSDAMELRRIIPSDITASAIAHVSLLTLFVLFSEVHPFGAVTAEQIPVEIVTPQELAEQQAPLEEPPAENKPEPAPSRQPDFSLLDKPASAAATPPAAPPAPAARPQKQAALAAPRAAEPQTPSQQVAPPPSQPAAPAYKPPEPDVSIKYQVLLGLPPDLSPSLPPALAQGPNKGDDNFDAPATDAADIASTLIAAFRRHLKTCSKLPASLSGADDVKVKLRVLMTPDGRLAAEPILIEASASMKGPLLMQGAIRALQACQPYAMLPADRYGEWKVLDLSFTPQDFTSG
jgi:outer membrane biosynthesis protein TonB